MNIYTSEDLKPHPYGGVCFKSSLISDPCRIKMSHFNSTMV